MSDQTRDDRGRYEEIVSLDDVRGLFRRSEPRTAAEIAAELGVSSRTALNKLEQLHDVGEIKRKQVGARAVVWYRELKPGMAAEVLAEATGRPVDAFDIRREDYPRPAPEELPGARVEEN